MNNYKVLKPFCDHKKNLKLLKKGDVIQRTSKEAEKLLKAEWIEVVKK